MGTKATGEAPGCSNEAKDRKFMSIKLCKWAFFFAFGGRSLQIFQGIARL